MAQTQPDVHPVQAHILHDLLYRSEARFAELNTSELKMTNDHFTFHVNKLLADELLEKTDTGAYTLTAKGKEFANRFDTDKKMAFVQQAKIGVLLNVLRVREGKTEYVVHQRLKQPYYGFHGSFTGKIGLGETADEAARRELLEETGLTGEPKFVGVRHKMDYSEEGALLEDKYFFIYVIAEPKGTLIESFKDGRNFWATMEERKKLPDQFPDVEDNFKQIEEQLKTGQIRFQEKKYTVEKF